MEKIFLLLAIYQLKHFICDYPLQTPYMLKKFNEDWTFLKPLSAHAGVHALFTLVISGIFGGVWLAILLAVFDFVTHFSMDRIKAGPKYLGRFKNMYHKYFWWSLGLDQMVHHLTHYAIIYFIMKG